MKDLYRRIGVAPDSSEAEIVAAIKKRSASEDAQAAREILLNPARRKQYDRAYAALRFIGRLRVSLNLGNAPFADDCADFCLAEKAPEVYRPKTQRTSRFPVGVTVTAVLVAAVILGISIASSQKKPQNLPVSVSNEREEPRFSPSQNTHGTTQSATKSDSENARCRAGGISRPANGKIISQTAKGDYPLVVENSGRDALVKLKDQNGTTVLFFFVRANETVRIDNVPEGVYKFQHATGKEYSSACQKFLTIIAASEDPEYKPFRNQTGGRYILKPVLDGNLEMRNISPEDF